MPPVAERNAYQKASAYVGGVQTGGGINPFALATTWLNGFNASSVTWNAPTDLGVHHLVVTGMVPFGDITNVEVTLQAADGFSFLGSRESTMLDSTTGLVPLVVMATSLSGITASDLVPFAFISFRLGRTLGGEATGPLGTDGNVNPATIYYTISDSANATFSGIITAGTTLSMPAYVIPAPKVLSVSPAGKIAVELDGGYEVTGNPGTETVYSADLMYGPASEAAALYPNGITINAPANSWKGLALSYSKVDYIPVDAFGDVFDIANTLIGGPLNVFQRFIESGVANLDSSSISIGGAGAFVPSSSNLTITTHASTGTYDVSDGSKTATFNLADSSTLIIPTDNDDATITLVNSDGGGAFPGGVVVDGRGNVTLDIVGGTMAFASDLGVNASNLTLQASGGAAISFGASQHLAALILDAGTSATLTAGNASVLVLGNLSIAGGATPTARLDLNDGAIILPSGISPTDLSAVVAQLIAGRNGGGGSSGSWAGSEGIVSNAANVKNVAADYQYFAIGYAPTLANGTLLGQSYNSGAFLIRYTLSGDATLDGSVDLNDLNAVLNNLGSTGAAWWQGNLDYTPSVDLNSLNYVLNELGGSLPP